jgi:hypothetical protein
MRSEPSMSLYSTKKTTSPTRKKEKPPPTANSDGEKKENLFVRTVRLIRRKFAASRLSIFTVFSDRPPLP